MAKLNQHFTPSNNKRLSFGVRFLVIGSLMVLLLWNIFRFFQKQKENTHALQPDGATIESSISDALRTAMILDHSITGTNTLVKHQFFNLSYSEQHEQAEWVAYTLTVEQLNSPKQKRFDYFAPDLSIKTRSAIHRDYTGSGYSRGHLAPAADMAYHPKASEECFYMSNISPQLKSFNGGIWRELEENVRDWARANKKIYVVTGPVLRTGIIKKIGDQRISVPSLFYKVILDLEQPEQKGIGFVLPNEKSELPLENYMVTIDSVEQLTGINFFNATNSDPIIESMEKKFKKESWKIKEGRFKSRVEVWNKKE